MMLSMYGVMLRTFLAPLPLACSLLGILCLVLFLLWKLLPSLRLCVNTYVVLTVMPCIVLGQPHPKDSTESLLCVLSSSDS